MIDLITEKITPMKNNNYTIIYLVVFLMTMPLFAFTPIVTHDCNGNEQGSITFDHFCYDAPNGPFVFTWQKNGTVVYSGSTSTAGVEIDLLDIGEGTYTLMMNDADMCQGVHTFEIEDKPCPEIEVSNPSCGITTTDGFEICVGASIIVKGLANGYSIGEWDCGPDCKRIEVENMVDTYEVFWGSPGNKTISFLAFGTEGSTEVLNTSVVVSANGSACPDIGVSYDFCSASNSCDFAGADVTVESSCQISDDNISAIGLHYNGINLPNNNPYSLNTGTSNEIVYTGNSINSDVGSYANFNVYLDGPFLGSVYIFARDETTGCSMIIKEITDCSNCNSGMVLFPKGDYWIEAFDCDGGIDGVINLDFEVACGSPPYTLSFNPPINLIKDEFGTNFINAEIPSDFYIEPNVIYNMTVTDANGNTVSQEIECDMFGGTGPGGGTPASNNCPTPSPVFNSITSYNYCVSDNNFCIDYNVSDSGDIYAVYVRNFPDKLVLFNNNTVPNAQGQFCFELDELSIGSNVVDVVAYGSGCLSDFTTQQYTININDYNYLPHNKDLNVINATELNDNSVYYLSCLSDQISLEATAGYGEYKWYLDGSLMTTTTSNQLNINNQPGNYTVVYFDPNQGSCGTYISEYVFIYKIADETVSPSQPLGYTFSHGFVQEDCYLYLSVTIQALGGSGNYEISWSDCTSDCNSNSTIFNSANESATITDLCTSEVLTACFRKNSCLEVVPCSDVTPCQEDDEDTEGGLATDLRITPTVYNESTTVKVTLAQESNVSLRYTGAMGGEFTQVLDGVVLPAGENDVLVNTANDLGGVKVFILDTDCGHINRLGVKTN